MRNLCLDWNSTTGVGYLFVSSFIFPSLTVGVLLRDMVGILFNCVVGGLVSRRVGERSLNRGGIQICGMVEMLSGYGEVVR